MEFKEYSVTTNKGKTHPVSEPIAEYVLYLEENLNNQMIERNKFLSKLEHIERIVRNEKITGIEAKLMILDLFGGGENNE